MNLDDLSDFVLVASNNGFAQASRASGRPKASLSRKVMELEASLGVRLFERDSRSVHLTEEGKLLFSRASGPLTEIAEVVDQLRDGKVQPRGRLRVSVPNLFGQMLMGRLAAKFSMAYPAIELELTMDDRAVDLVSEGYDVVIRVNPDPNSELVGRCFAREPLLIVAAPSVVRPAKTRGSPDREPIQVVVRGSTRKSTHWQIAGTPGCEFQTHTVLALPTFTMVRDAVLTGIGAAKLPRMVVADDLATGRLVSWGPSANQTAELWILHTSKRFASAKVKAFMQFVESTVPDEIR